MTEKWAYTAHGRTRLKDFWELFSPFAHTELRSKQQPFGQLLSPIRDSISAKKCLYPNAIGFDGARWIVGRTHLPVEVLDSAIYKPELYNVDTVGRPLHFFHGYMSETAELPRQIPRINKEHFARCHLTHIVPLWGKTEIGCTQTNFQAFEDMVNLSAHLPPDAILALEEAHGAGKPIGIQYDPGKKVWRQVTEFEKTLEGMSRATSISISVGEPSAGPSIWTKPAAAEPMQAASWVEQICGATTGKKLAIAGGAVALGAIGYWALNRGKESPDR